MNKPAAIANSLYIHLPFCEKLCPYCDFPKMLHHPGLVKKYLMRLEEELFSYHPTNLKTIYLGGGTPTSLTSEEFQRLLEIIAPYTPGVEEFTLEANIENATREKLILAKRFGVNRLSFGIGSFDETVLKKIRREHTFFLVEEKINEARSLGFNNINLDLIYGLPSQDFAVWKKDVELVLSLKVEHLSAYSLIIEPNTPFYAKGVSPQTDEEARQCYDYLLEQARAHGYERYEVSAFSKPGFASKHNLTYWTNKEYYGVGLGASGYLNGRRYTNTKKLNDYLKDHYLGSEEILTPLQKEEEYLYLHLRLSEGFSLNEFQEKFGVNFPIKYQESLQKMENTGLFNLTDDRFYLTDEGLMKLDYFFTHL